MPVTTISNKWQKIQKNKWCRNLPSCCLSCHFAHETNITWQINGDGLLLFLFVCLFCRLVFVQSCIFCLFVSKQNLSRKSCVVTILFFPYIGIIGRKINDGNFSSVMHFWLIHKFFLKRNYGYFILVLMAGISNCQF